MRTTGIHLLASGLPLVAAAWWLNWGLSGLRTHLLFFPLWFGYVLVVNGLCELRTGTSAWSRSRRRFALSFVASIPVWWLFELFNLRLGNWEYLGRDQFTDLEYFVLASVSFSTVMPAVLGTAELMRSLPFFERFARGPVVRPTPRLEATLVLLGLGMLAAMLAWPGLFFPFAWTSLVLLLEPLARRLGRRNLLDDLARGDWRTWMALWAGGLTCGFFWEMWNVYCYPKWIYHIPGVGFWKVFEMPLLGYLGYLPFALELFLMAQLFLPGARELRLGPPRRQGAALAAGGG
jgi:hypothetical protein